MRKKWKIPFSILKFVNIILLFLPFAVCWYEYYEPKTLTANSKQVSVLLFFLLIVVSYVICFKLDAFRISVLQIRDIFFSQVLAIGFTDVIAYILIWMLSIHMPRLLPGILCLVFQCIVALIWSFAVHRYYFWTHDPLPSVVIYDVRHGMEDLIQEYGLQKRFKIIGTYPVEDILEHFEYLKDAEAVFICGVHSHDRNIVLKHCIYNKIKVFQIPRVGDVMMSGAEKIHMLHLPILKSQYQEMSIETRAIKRLIDIIISGTALILLSPIMLIVTLLVKSDGGPAFYKQKRLTQGNRVFEIIKFRSMRVDAEKLSGPVLSAGEDDPRITKVGRFIRACRLDELPQLINILKGDMSIVGPRPERPEIAAEIQKTMPEFQLRTQVKAGLTGYAQVYGKYNTTFYDKLLMDLMYIAKPSIVEDLAIMLATVKILFSKESTEGVGKEQPMMMYEEHRKDNSR